LDSVVGSGLAIASGGTWVWTVAAEAVRLLASPGAITRPFGP
jgi:hypothetical protein